MMPPRRDQLQIGDRLSAPEPEQKKSVSKTLRQGVNKVLTSKMMKEQSIFTHKKELR